MHNTHRDTAPGTAQASRDRGSEHRERACADAQAPIRAIACVSWTLVRARSRRQLPFAPRAALAPAHLLALDPQCSRRSHAPLFRRLRRSRSAPVGRGRPTHARICTRLPRPSARESPGSGEEARPARARTAPSARARPVDGRVSCRPSAGAHAILRSPCALQPTWHACVEHSRCADRLRVHPYINGVAAAAIPVPLASRTRRSCPRSGGELQLDPPRSRSVAWSPVLPGPHRRRPRAVGRPPARPPPWPVAPQCDARGRGSVRTAAPGPSPAQRSVLAVWETHMPLVISAGWLVLSAPVLTGCTEPPDSGRQSL